MIDDVCIPLLEKGNNVKLIARNELEEKTLDKKCDKQIIAFYSENTPFLDKYVCCCKKDEDYTTNRENNAFENLKIETALKYNEQDDVHETTLESFYNEGKQIFSDKEREKNTIWILYGFQSNTPTNDFRGGGYHSLKFMHYYTMNYPHETSEILKFPCFPFALSAIHISFTKLEDTINGKIVSIKRKSLKNFLFNYITDADLLFKIESSIMSCFVKYLTDHRNSNSDPISIRLNNWIENHINNLIAQLNDILNNDDRKISLKALK